MYNDIESISLREKWPYSSIDDMVHDNLDFLWNYKENIRESVTNFTTYSSRKYTKVSYFFGDPQKLTSDMQGRYINVALQYESSWWQLITNTITLTESDNYLSLIDYSNRLTNDQIQKIEKVWVFNKIKNTFQQRRTEILLDKINISDCNDFRYDTNNKEISLSFPMSKTGWWWSHRYTLDENDVKKLRWMLVK